MSLGHVPGETNASVSKRFLYGQWEPASLKLLSTPALSSGQVFNGAYERSGFGQHATQGANAYSEHPCGSHIVRCFAEPWSQAVESWGNFGRAARWTNVESGRDQHGRGEQSG